MKIFLTAIGKLDGYSNYRLDHQLLETIRRRWVIVLHTNKLLRHLFGLCLVVSLVGCDWFSPGPSQSEADDRFLPKPAGKSDASPLNQIDDGTNRTSDQRFPVSLPLDSVQNTVQFTGLNNILSANQGAGVRESFENTNADDLIWAVSECQCASKWTYLVLKTTLETRGALPQVLVPQVREAILKDSRIRSVINLPGGADGVIARIFANDSQLESTIRSTLVSMIQTAWQNPLRIGASGNLLFDGFPPLPWERGSFNSTGDDNIRPSGFDLSKAALRWILIGSVPAPWAVGPARNQSGNPLEQDIQLLSWTRMMAEVNYVLGISRGFDGRIYGGLMLNPLNPEASLTGFEAQPASGAPSLAMSGKLSVSYQPMNALKLILNGREQWQRLPGLIELQEQARIWKAGALLFRGLRLESRKYPGAIFGSNSANLFPADAQRLGLAFLQGMSVLLAEQFVSLQSMSIGDAFSIPEQRVLRAETDVLSMVRIASAMAEWLTEIQTIDSSGLPDDDKTLMRTKAGPDIRDAIRLAVFRGLRRSADWQSFESGDGKMSLANQAEMIAVFAKIEQELLRSGFVRRRLAVFGQKMIDDLVARSSSRGGRLDLNPEEAIWVRLALDRLKVYAVNESEFDSVVQFLSNGISAWDSTAAL